MSSGWELIGSTTIQNCPLTVSLFLEGPVGRVGENVRSSHTSLDLNVGNCFKISSS